MWSMFPKETSGKMECEACNDESECGESAAWYVEMKNAYGDFRFRVCQQCLGPFLDDVDAPCYVLTKIK